MSREAMKQALEALENYDGQTWEETKEAITALRQALEQPAVSEQRTNDEPVAWYIQEKDSATTDGCWAEKNLDICEPLYTRPQPAAQWVGLTEQEQEELWDEAVDRQEHFCSQYGDFADAIEAKLRKKNGGGT